jgi:hypothetical protein
MSVSSLLTCDHQYAEGTCAQQQVVKATDPEIVRAVARALRWRIDTYGHAYCPAHSGIPPHPSESLPGEGLRQRIERAQRFMRDGRP